jgi:hypothetical protein
MIWWSDLSRWDTLSSNMGLMASLKTSEMHHGRIWPDFGRIRFYSVKWRKTPPLLTKICLRKRVAGFRRIMWVFGIGGW